MVPHEKIKDNDFLCNLDMDSATREQKIDWLCQIIKNETEKPENEQDVALISECSDYIRELSEEELSFSEEELQQGLAKIKLSSQESDVTVLPRKRYKKKLVKAVIILTATFVVLFSGTTVAAKTQGYSNAWEFVSLNVERIFKMSSGDTLQEGNITLIKGEKSIVYASIEELIEKEKYNVLYPSELPEDIKIEKIKQNNLSDNSIILTLQTNDSNLIFSISSNSSIFDEDLQEFEIYQTSYTTFYIDTKPNNVYQAIGYFEDYEYRIIYNDYDALISILNNLKGPES